MSLLAVAFPVISKTHFEWIQSYRSINDELYYTVILPHFTLVFPEDDISEKDFVNEILLQSKDQKRIEFEITKAIVVKDAFKNYYHEFLIPEKGYDAVTTLHDQIYSEKLFSYRKKDIEYIPHIGIGNTENKNKCEERVNKINAKPVSIKGIINSITILHYQNSAVRTISEIKLL